MTAKNDDRRGLLIEAMETIERLEERLRSAEDSRREPIAVIGVGCRLPGGAEGPDGYWRLLAEGRDAVVDVPPGRWEHDRFLGDDPEVPGTIRARGAGFLTGWEPDRFDASFFGISPREAAAMDPQQRLLLEVAWEALEHAGLRATDLRGSATGVFTGVTLHEYAVRQLRHLGPEDVDAYTVTSSLPNHASGRLSYFFGFNGPSIAVDAACASSLVSTHLACQSLRTGESSLALAAGTNLMLMPETSITMNRWGALAPDGRCKAFDAAADGLGRGEGCGVVVLKRLADARRDGDRVLAVIRGSAVNQDGASSNFTAPNGLAQEAVIRAALSDSRLTPEDIDYVEAHGTGTALGDPIELEALAAVFGDRAAAAPLIVGSAKTNIGHVEAAAGIAGLIKSVLSLRHGHIPPHLHFRRMTPRISRRAAELRIPTDGTDWPNLGRPARAGVSAFGVSGTNAHIVLEEYRADADPEPTAVEDAPGDRHRLYPLYAATPEALGTAARRLADHLETADRGDRDGDDRELLDVGRTLTVHRTPLPERLVVLARDRAELVAGLRAHAENTPSAQVLTGRARASSEADAVWVFSGFGSQWAGMGRELLEAEPAFGDTVDLLEPVMRQEGGFSLRACLGSGDFGDVAQSQPVVYALQVGLAAVWRSWGLRPAAVLGHSMGEVAAAVAAGALTSADGARVMCRRSRLLREHLAGKGGMALVELPAAEAAARLAGHPDLNVAVHASPRSTVVAGPNAALEALVAEVRDQGLMAKQIRGANGAGHSPQVDPLLPLIERALADIVPAEPDVPVYTTVLEDPRTVPVFGAGHWAANARNPVRFTDAVTAAAEDGHRLFLEVSPHPITTQSVTETLATLDVTDAYVSGSTRREEPERETLLTALAGLHVHGVSADWRRLHPSGELTTLPTNPWRHESHWYTSVGRGRGEETGGHPLLGTGVRVPGPPVQHVWRGTVDTDRLPWLADHRSEDAAVMPGTAYCEMVLAAAAEAFGVHPADVRAEDIEYLRLLTLEEPVETVTVLTEETADSGVVEILSWDSAGEQVRHARARVRRAAAGEQPVRDLDALAARHPEHHEAGSLYARLRAAGQHHGPAFAGVTGVATSPDHGHTALGSLALPARCRVGSHGMYVHPALLDSAMQLLGAAPTAAEAVTADGPGSVLLPTGVGSLRVWGDPSTGVRCLTEVARPERDDAAGAALVGRLLLLDADGSVVVEASDVRLMWLSRAPRSEAEHAPLLHELSWHREPLEAAVEEPGAWLVLAESADDPLAGELRERLGEEACRVLTAVDEEEVRAAAADPVLRGVVLLLPPARADETLRAGAPEAALERAEERVARLLALARALATTERPAAGPPRLRVAGHGALPVDGAETVVPEQTALRGVIRTLGWEHPELRASLTDFGAAPASAVVGDLVAELAADTDEEEVAYRDGDRLVARLGPVTEERRAAHLRRPVEGGSAFRLESTEPGNLDAVRPVRRERGRPAEGEVEIRVEAAGINFSDVLKGMGWYRLPENDDRELHLGGECAGVVSAVGPGVEGVEVGDRVVAIAFHSFASHTITRQELVVPLPEGLDAVAAAGLPTAYGTAWYGLVEVGRLEPGERVLIHAASGGVGLAAVSIARARGARVYATAGNEAKREFLRDSGVECVLDSRSATWAEELREATGGAGVDVVLNSLPGAAIRWGLEALAPGGRFIELGKRDIHQDLRLGLLPFARALTLSAVDFDLLTRSRPALVGRLLRETVNAVADGVLDVLPSTAFPLDRATEAFRVMAAAEHIGKLVVTVDDEPPGRVVVRPGTVPFARRDGAYVISGGLTGIGLATARRLAERGAGALVLNGRGEPSEPARRVIEEVRALGASVQVVLGDVARPGTAEQLVAAAKKDGRPLRGVVHSAAALDDAAVLQQDRRRLGRAWWPKAVGAWRLHAATEGEDLDWWVGYSSTASLLGSAGQANYAAACAYLDGLALWRRERGLPALSVDWGPWESVGGGQGLADRGYRMISPDTGFAALEELISQGRCSTGVLHFDIDTWFADFPAAAASPLYAGFRASEGGGGAPAPGLPAALAAASDGPARRRLLEAELTEQLRTVLRLGPAPVDPAAPLSTFGIDSLGALELRNRLEKALGITLPATLVWAHPTLAALAGNLGERLGFVLDPPTGDPAPEPDPDLTDGDQELLAQILRTVDEGAAERTPEEPAR
ncbi:type I polyketide synthase [Streptomyces sp. TP-A0874]|uniref:type I polyketide synthase n=1 Tax=Streptomyces sp. TP-A0874 TaxID=549819 RepID=UPI000853BF98|nr:type I polyketide synthase [Streptomyces sp. TP-A0874]